MKRSLILTLAAGATLLCAGAAQAGNVQWSIGINLPPVGTVISNGPVYYPAPAQVYYPPAPVYYPPAPVYYPEPAPVYYPAPVTYAPPVVYESPAVVYRAPYGSYREVRPIVYAPRAWERPGHHHDQDWRAVPPGRDARWVPPGHRDERRYRHEERSDYRY